MLLISEIRPPWGPDVASALEKISNDFACNDDGNNQYTRQESAIRNILSKTKNFGYFQVPNKKQKIISFFFKGQKVDLFGQLLAQSGS